VDQAEEEVGVEAVGAGTEGRRVVDDGAPPRLAGAGAADDVGGVQTPEDMDDHLRG
jgi:hypothetical protein